MLINGKTTTTAWATVLFLVLQFGALTVSAVIGCAAEAK
jgi:hypothetical protein